MFDSRFKSSALHLWVALMFSTVIISCLFLPYLKVAMNIVMVTTVRVHQVTFNLCDNLAYEDNKKLHCFHTVSMVPSSLVR